MSRFYCLVIFVLYSYPGVAEALPDSVQSNQADSIALLNQMERGKSLIYEHPDSAIFLLGDLIDRARDEKTIADAKSWSGVAHYVKGEYDYALNLFTEARQVYARLNDVAGLSSSYNRIGLIYQTQRRFSIAIEYHRKGLEYASRASSLDRIVANHFNIGLAYDESGEYDSALTYLIRSLALSKEIGFHQMILMNFNRMAKVHYHMGELPLAKLYYDSVLNYPHLKNRWETAFSLTGLAEVYIAEGRIANAIQAGEQSLNLAREMKAKWDIVHAAEVLSRAYATRRDFEKAYEFSLLTQAYKDSLFNEEKENKLNFIHLRENELAKARLEKENAIQSTRIKEKNSQIIVASVVSTSLLVVIFAFYAKQRQSRRLHRSLVETNRKIEQQVKELDEMNQAKSKLFSILSHDLRTPFSQLEGLLHLHASGALTEQERETLFKQLEHTFHSVSDTLDSLLQWANSQMEGLRANPDRLNLDAIIEKTKTFWEPAIRNKSLVVSHETGGPDVYADVYQLTTVIRNVLGNAIKFTPPSGEIKIQTIVRGSKVGIAISDTGVGMPSDMQESLFTFQRDNRRLGTLKEKGTGLGLMISTQLIEKNNGSIEVESEEGKGTTFIIWVPAA